MDIEHVLQNYPKIEQYLGNHIRRLQAEPPEKGNFVYLFSRGDPGRLERRLQRTCKTDAFQTIFREIGSIEDPGELDRRMLDAWAEIRTIDQLVRERFIDIRKVKTPADLVARYMSQVYVVQVTRISREPRFAGWPTGDPQRIYDEACPLVDQYLGDSIEKKNLGFRDVSPMEYVRRITVVTSLGHLQNPLNRHIACRRIKESLFSLSKGVTSMKFSGYLIWEMAQSSGLRHRVGMSECDAWQTGGMARELFLATKPKIVAGERLTWTVTFPRMSIYD
jgi:hypothetical protein